MNPIWYIRLGILGLFVGLGIVIVLQHAKISDLKAEMAEGEAQAEKEKTTLVTYINTNLVSKIEAQTKVEKTYEDNQKATQVRVNDLNLFANRLRQQLAEQTSGAAGSPVTDPSQASGALTRARQEAQACWKLVNAGVPVVAGCATDAELLRDQVEGLLDDAHAVCRGESLK